MIKAIIFDLNGVFIQSPKLSDRFAEAYGVPQNEFLPALNEVMKRVRMPGADRAFVYWRRFFDQWGLRLSEEEFLDFWFSAEKVVPEMVELAGELKKRGLKLFILSNNFAERAQYYQENFVFLRELFDKIYYSWQTGLVKPNAHALRVVLQENNLQPDECVYFDDSKANVYIARELGIRAYEFKDAHQVRSAFVDYSAGIGLITPSERARGIIVKGDEILIIHRHNQRGDYYVFPGGGIEVGESPEQALIRELSEETSLKVNIVRLFDTYEYESKQYFYLCDYISGEPKIRSDSIEAERQREGNTYSLLWWPIGRLNEVLLYPLEIRDKFAVARLNK